MKDMHNKLVKSSNIIPRTKWKDGKLVNLISENAEVVLKHDHPTAEVFVVRVLRRKPHGGWQGVAVENPFHGLKHSLNALVEFVDENVLRVI